MTTTIRAFGTVLAAAALTVLRAGDVKAQERAADAPLPPCTEGRMLGSLGITGLECTNCSFSSTRGVIVRARFDTEPVIIGVNEESALRVGDVLIAVDGDLITTRAGADRLASVGPNASVRLRVRRDGTEREVRVRAIPSCVRAAMREPPSPPRAPRALDPLPPTTPGAPISAPLPPVASGTPSVPTPPLPALAPMPPSMSDIRPDARLGFGFECGPCSYSSAGATWSFETYPTVFRLEPGGPADGLLQPGDELRAVNGADLLTEAGGRAFSAIRPGGEIRWTIARDGRVREVVTRAEPKARDLVPAAVAAPRAPEPAGARSASSSARRAEEEALAAAAAGEATAALRSARLLRYAGGIGPAQVEVRGEAVTVTREGNVLIVRTRGNEIRIVVDEGGGGVNPPAP
jgi:hypothetical protein